MVIQKFCITDSYSAKKQQMYVNQKTITPVNNLLFVIIAILRKAFFVISLLMPLV